MNCSLGISNFLEEISSVSHSSVSSASLHCSSLLAILWNSGTQHLFGCIFPFLPCFLLLFSAALCVKPPQTTTLPFCISFSLGWFWSLPPVQCYKPLSIVLQALCLPDLIPWIYSSPPLYNHRGFDLGHSWMTYRFSLTFCSLKLNFAMRADDLSHSQL